MKKSTISLIVTCYNEEENIHEMYIRVKKVFAQMRLYEFEIIFVDNHSTDGSIKQYESLLNKDKRVKLIVLSRNFGSPQPSFLAGMEHSLGDVCILLHGDIQDPPELIPELIKKWKEGYKVVYGIRTKREGYSFIWQLMYKGFYFLLRRLAYITIPLDAGDFSLLDRRVVNELLKLDEYDYYVRCLRAFVGFSQIGVPYVREARHHGRSNESLLTGFWWAKTILVNFSFKPLEWISLFALFVVVFAFILMLLNLVNALVYGGSPSGIPTIVILILFLGGVQLLSLSVIAEYLSKIFLEVKHRPKYIIEYMKHIPYEKKKI